MKKKLFYTSPECDIIKMQIEGVIATSEDGYIGFDHNGGAEDFFWF
ncbi:MAG: hypothetical protein J6Z32_05205 [Bacteroidales bacterium]|nr:hypothetical protein [Bacteroidales bacterium]